MSDRFQNIHATKRVLQSETAELTIRFVSLPEESEVSIRPPENEPLSLESSEFVGFLNRYLPNALGPVRARFSTMERDRKQLKERLDEARHIESEIRKTQQSIDRRKSKLSTVHGRYRSAIVRAGLFLMSSLFLIGIDVPLAVVGLVAKIGPGADPFTATLTAWVSAIAITLMMTFAVEQMMSTKRSFDRSERRSYYVKFALCGLFVVAVCIALAMLRKESISDGTASDWAILGVIVIGYPAFAVLSALSLEKFRACCQEARNARPGAEIDPEIQELRVHQSELRSQKRTAREQADLKRQEYNLIQAEKALLNQTVSDVLSDPLVIERMQHAMNSHLYWDRNQEGSEGGEC